MDASAPAPSPPDRRPIVVGVDTSDSAHDADTLAARGSELLAAHLAPVPERHPGLPVERDSSSAP